MLKRIRETFFISVLPILAFAMALFVFGPSQIFLTNTAEFAVLYFDLFRNGIVLSLILSLILLAILLWIRSRSTAHQRIISVILAISVLMWLQGSFLVWNFGLLDGRDIRWSAHLFPAIIDGTLWLVLICLAGYKPRILFKRANQISLALILLQFFSIGFLLLRMPDVPSFKRYTADASNKFAFSKNQNVIILVLDTFQTDFFQELINEDDSLKEKFDGFTYFRNSLSGHPFTTASTSNILTGEFYEGFERFEKHLREAYTANSIPKILKANGFEVDLYPFMPHGIYFDETIASNFKKSGISGEQMREELAFLFDLALFRQLPTVLKILVQNDQNWLLKRHPDRLGFLIPDTARERSSKKKSLASRYSFSADALDHSSSLRFIQQMSALARVSEERKVFKYYHVDLPHWPLRINEKLQYEKMDVTRANFKRQCLAAVKVAILFLQELKRLKLYDNSLIFLIADHGAGAQKQKFIYQTGFPGTEKERVVSQGRMINALALTLVKPFHSQGPLTTSNAPVCHSDISSTIFSELRIPVQGAGKSVFHIQESDRRVRRYITYSGYNAERDEYPAVEEWLVTGYSWLTDSWRRSDRTFTAKGIVYTTAKTYSLGEVISFGKTGNSLQYQRYGWKSGSPSFSWTDGKSASLRIPVEPIHSDVALKAHMFPYLAEGGQAKQRVGISINGETIHSWDVAAEGDYGAVIPQNKLKGSFIDLTFDLPDAHSALSSKGKNAGEFGVALKSLSLRQATIFSDGSVIDFRNAESISYLTSGWGTGASRCVWSLGKRALLTIPIDQAPKHLVLAAEVEPFLNRGRLKSQHVNITINGSWTSSWEVTSAGEYRISVPERIASVGVLTIDFEFPDAARRRVNAPGKQFGLCLRKIVFRTGP